MEFLIVDDTLECGPDGLDLVRRVRSDAKLVDLPIILLAAHNADLDEYKEQLSNFDLAQIVAKPFSPRETAHDGLQLLDHHDKTTLVDLIPAIGMASLGSLV